MGTETGQDDVSLLFHRHTMSFCSISRVFLAGIFFICTGFSHGEIPTNVLEHVLKPLSLRGTAFELPMWVGTTMYDNHWRAYEDGENAGNGPFFDRTAWTQRFKAMEHQGLSVVALTHPHPFPAFVRLSEYPEVVWGDEATYARNQAMLRWILAEGKKHGISIYFLTWNICLPSKWALAHGFSEFGSDTPMTRQYTRAMIAAFFRIYPELGGLITMAAESPPGCVDFVADAICGGLQESGTQPSLIFWSWCAYPEDARKISAAYPGTRMMHYLQYEQLFAPCADARIGRFSEACGGAKMVALGGPKSAEGYTFWGDPAWARTIVRDLIRQNGDGLFIETYCEEPWLAQEAFALYAREPNRRYRNSDWIRSVGAHYQRPDMAKPLFDAMVHASRITPRFLMLLHSQSDHFMPQIGLPLVYYLEMPTVSSYVFENVQSCDAAGYLRPNLGLCWPNPAWGEQVQSVKDYAARGKRKGYTSPEHIADEMDIHIRHCVDALNLLTGIESGNSGNNTGDLQSLLSLLRFNTALGQHYAEKIRAAIAWAQWQQGKNTKNTCLAHLDKALQAWETVVALANQRYPNTIPLWQSNLVAAPPWTQNQIWNAYFQQEGHWRDRLKPFQREKELIAEEFKKPRTKTHLPLWEEIQTPEPSQMDLVYEDGFENTTTDAWQWPTYASLTQKKEMVSEGKQAVLLDSRKKTGEWHEPLLLRPGKAPMKAGKRYLLVFDYTVVDPGSPFPDNPFVVAARSMSTGSGNDIGTTRTWTGTIGSHGRRFVYLNPEKQDDYVPFFSLHGQAAVALDKVQLFCLH